MELRNLAIFGLVLLAASQCSEARHSMHRRESSDYDIAADEGTDDALQNDEDNFGEHSTTEPTPDRPIIQAQITTPSKVYEVKSGSDVRLECNVDPDDGTVVQWYKGGDLYFMNAMKTFYDRDLSRYSIVPMCKDLHIKAVEASDAGVYKCEVAQSSPVSVEHTIVMLVSPEIVRFTATNNGEVEEGANLLLTCDVIGRPPPTIVWSREVDGGNKRLGEQDGEFSQNSVLMKGVKRELSGKYYCYAFNSVGNNQAEIEVSITGKPHVHVHRTVINSALKVEAILQCFTRYAKKPLIRWYKDGRLIEDSFSEYVVSTHGTHSNLTVTPDDETDFGTYTCEAENPAGKHNRSIELVQRPVVEAVRAEPARLLATVRSHQELLELQAQLKPKGQDGEWKQFAIPLPSSRAHSYEVALDLSDKLEAGEYEAVVKARNNYSWSDNIDPVMLEIDVQPSMAIQHAGVFLGSNSHSIRPSSVILSTILMYLLLRPL